MAYNPYNDILKIYRAGNDWQNEQDEKKRKTIQQNAQTYYNKLRENGYGSLADELQVSDSAKRKQLLDRYSVSGMSSTRDYLYSLGKAKGMSQNDVDNLIGWNNTTGEVSFGGKNLGKPDAAVDGVSYWKDTSVLDNAFNDYISRSGTTVPTAQMSSQNSAEVQNKINQLWGTQTEDHSYLTDKYKQEYKDIKNTNPFTTEEAKSILAKYDLAGLQARDNEAASGSASNGGNIDSFAAANALRQQAALVGQGQDKVLAAYQQKVDNARTILESLGVSMQNDYTGMQNTIGLQQNEAQRLFENDETAKNNDVARKSEISSVTGYSPDEWVVSNNPYMNDDGTIKDEYKDIDFAAVMANAKATGNTEAYNAAAQARYYKIMGNYGLYGKWDNGDYIVPGKQKTENARQFDKQIESAENIAKGENSTTLALADKEAKAAIDQINASKTSSITEEYIDQAVKNINSSLGYDAVVKKGDWSYGLPESSKDAVYDYFVNDDSIYSDDEALAILLALGFSEDELYRRSTQKK